MYNSLVLFVFGLLLIGASGQDQQPEQSALTKFFYDRCQKYSRDASVYDRLKADVGDFKKYAKYTATYLPNQVGHFCKLEQGHLRGRMKAITTTMTKCLPAEEHFLGDFVYQSFRGFLHFLCDNEAENVHSFFSSQGSDCRSNINTEEITQCFGKIFAPVDGRIQKKELCDNLNVAQKCYSQSLDRHCPNFRAFQKLNQDLFNYIERPCSTSGSKTVLPAVQGIFFALIFCLIRFTY
ncbi:uncharacterized protein LOC109604717 [Aethina tumida]|uniref:uncharacterized protein LOC109604717 n=1 Tax=Aethina tumida TaxID=116153 RepID=UPI00096B094E|nr:uncharacterized protein LOC109604717 [Aethina tumida]